MRILAPAKLNRFLAVLGRREDDFHDLELVTTVLEGCEGLTDILEGEVMPGGLSLHIHGPCAEGLAADERNLVIRAWRLLEEECFRPLPARLSLEKRIPFGAGLGGGSSDAAAALRLGNALFDLNLPLSTLLHMGAQLGSDVPLFLLGGSVLGLGRGERVFPLRDIPLEPILIVHPGFQVSTQEVYRALARTGYPEPERCPPLAPGDTPPWRNDLQAPSIFVSPLQAEVRESLLESGGEPLLCGSGACWAARYPNRKARDTAAVQLVRRNTSWRIWTV